MSNYNLTADSCGNAQNSQARMPEEILTSRVYENEAFDRLSSRFTRRFRNKEYGYTFFGIFTVKKPTVLSVSTIVLLPEFS